MHFNDNFTRQTHDLIPPILQQQIENCLNELVKKASAYFQDEIKTPQISYKLKGKVAGKAYLQLWQIRLNPQLLIENQQAYLDDVIAHEFAHLLAYQKYGRVKPHGQQWQAIMRHIFKRPAQTTHQFDITSVQGETFTYRCQCQIHQLSQQRHRKVTQQKTRYLCRTCQSELKFEQPHK